MVDGGWIGPKARDQLGDCCNHLGKGRDLAGELATGRAGLGEAASGGSLGAVLSLVQGCGEPSHASGNGQCWASEKRL